MRTHSLQELEDEYGEQVVLDSQRAVSKLLGTNNLAVLDIDDIPQVLQYLCQGEAGDWMLILSKDCTLFPVMELTTCYDLGSFSLLLGS